MHVKTAAQEKPALFFSAGMQQTKTYTYALGRLTVVVTVSDAGLPGTDWSVCLASRPTPFAGVNAMIGNPACI